MEKLNAQTEAIMNERFGHDNVIALATDDGGSPAVRYVNAYYENGAFYVLTHELSGKMQQLRRNPAAAVAGEWFTAQGEGISLGYAGRADNAGLLKKLTEAFASWIDNGHTDFSDQNTCILKIALKSGVLFSHGTRYEIDFGR